MSDDVKEQRGSNANHKPNGDFAKGNTAGFKKGQSGNSGGRPKRPSIMAAFNRLLAKGEFSLDDLANALFKHFEDGNPTALKEVMGRQDGPLASALQLTGSDGGPVQLANYDLNKLSSEKIRTLMGILSEAKRDDDSADAEEQESAAD